MAKSQETFSKKEREKQRKRKQQDKQEKRQERKSNNNKGKSLEDMMAYLDENGNLTDKPQDPRKKRVFRQEDIPLEVSASEERSNPSLRTGIVTFFNDHKGFGFINDAESRERIFFHINDLVDEVKENDKVTFTVKKSAKGPAAVNVTLINA